MKASDRLVFRELTPEDLPRLRMVFGDPEIMMYSVDGVKSDIKILDFVEESRIRYPEGEGQWGLFLKETGDFVGVAGFFDFYYEEEMALEISYRIRKPYWGRGLATEAATHLVRHALERLGRPRVYGIVDQRNEASRRVLQKAGMSLIDRYDYHGRQTDLYRIEAVQAERDKEEEK